MDQITEFMGTHFAEADYKVLFGNLLIVIGVCTILFFAFFETEPDIEVNSFVEVEKSAPTASPKRPASAKKGISFVYTFSLAFSPLLLNNIILQFCAL